MGKNPQRKANPKRATLPDISPRFLGLRVLSGCLLEIRGQLERPDEIHWEPDKDFDEEHPFRGVGAVVKTGAKYALQNLLALDRLIHEAEDNAARLLGEPLKSEVLLALRVVHEGIGQAEIPVESSIYDGKERLGVRFAVEQVTIARDRDGGRLAVLAEAIEVLAGAVLQANRSPAGAGQAVTLSKTDPLKNPNLSRSTRRLWEKLRAVQKPQTTDNMEGWGFSRHTIIKAVRELKASGHVTPCKGGGVLPTEPK